ncbi:hypothetical protein [Streptomyces sp. NPDC054797]
METRIGRALLAGDIADGSTVTLDVDDDHLTVAWQPPEAGQAPGAGAGAGAETA